VGGWPDYLLTLWSWEEEAIVLRSKAFSQDVYTIKYSPYFQVIERKELCYRVRGSARV
jgi:hypothetical protein